MLDHSYGYMTVCNDNVFYGGAINDTGDKVYNGEVVKSDVLHINTPDLSLVAVTKDGGNEFEIVELTDVYDGLPAIRVRVNKLVDLLYFVENQWNYNDSCAYEPKTHCVEAGEMMRVHALSEGEEFLVGPYTVSDNLLNKKFNCLKLNSRTFS